MPRKYSRQELINLIKDGKLSKQFFSELTKEDQSFAEILKRFPNNDEIQLFDAPEAIIQKAEAISTENEKYSIKSWVVNLILDSWKTSQVAGVRGVSTTSDRRLRFEIGSCLLDLRAEKQDKKWYFVAELTGHECDEEVVIKADKIEISANESGYFEWTSSNTPKDVKIQIGNNESVSLPELSWKTKK